MPTRCPTGRSGSPTAFRPTAADAASTAASRQRPEPGARRLRPLRPARRPGAVPAGRRPTTRSPTPPIGPLALLRLGEASATDLGRRPRSSCTPASPRGARSSCAGTRQAGGREALGEARRVWASTRRSSGSTGTAAWHLGDGGRSTAGRRGRRRAPSSRPAPRRPADTVGAVDLSVVVVFYNMAREAAPDPAVALPLATSATSRTSTTRCWSSTTGPTPTSASPPSSCELRSRVPPARPRRRRHALTDGGPQRRDRRSPRGALALMIDGAHVLTPGVLHFGMTALEPTSPPSSPPSSGTSGPGQQGDAQQAGYDQDGRGPPVPRSTGRSTATGSSRSATSSASATGSTASSRATACSCPASCSSRSAASTTASRCPAAATPTSTSSSGSALAPGITAASILGEGTSTSSTAARRPTSPTRPIGASGWCPTASTSRSCAAGRLLGLDRPVHYVGAMTTKAARRTRSRRQFTLDFDPCASTTRRDSRPRCPTS